MKRKFTIDEVINLCDNVYYITADDDLRSNSLGVTPQDVVDLCELGDIGFENVRWVKDIFEEFGGCWVAEKGDVEMYEADCDDSKHGGMFACGKPFERSSKMLVCLSVRVGRMLDEYCEKKNKDENVKIRNKIEDLMLAKRALCAKHKDVWVKRKFRLLEWG